VDGVVTAVVAAEKIEPSDEEILEALRPSAERDGISAEDLLERVRKSDKMGRLQEELAARQAIDLMRAHGLDTWVYSGNDWLITKIDAPHVAREAWTVKFEPKVVADVTEYFQQVAKIVGVSDDLDRVQRCEADAQAAFGQHATATRSQPYYLDVTNKDANKGAVVEYLSTHLGVPAKEIATIGDQPNDVLMFKRSGFSIAMGNASDEVKAQAAGVTDSYNAEGFAKAMETFILGSTRLAGAL